MCKTTFCRQNIVASVCSEATVLHFNWFYSNEQGRPILGWVGAKGNVKLMFLMWVWAWTQHVQGYFQAPFTTGTRKQKLNLRLSFKTKSSSIMFLHKLWYFRVSIWYSNSTSQVAKIYSGVLPQAPTHRNIVSAADFVLFHARTT